MQEERLAFSDIKSLVEGQFALTITHAIKPLRRQSVFNVVLYNTVLFQCWQILVTNIRWTSLNSRLPFLFAGSWQGLQELKCSPLLHAVYYSALIQHTSILYFVDHASRYKFLLITNLMHFFMYLFISCPYVFCASQHSSSGDQIV